MKRTLQTVASGILLALVVIFGRAIFLTCIRRWFW